MSTASRIELDTKVSRLVVDSSDGEGLADHTFSWSELHEIVVAWKQDGGSVIGQIS